VGGGVETLALFFFRHAQADDQVHDLVAGEATTPDQTTAVSTAWAWIQTWAPTSVSITFVVDVVDDAGAAQAPGVEHAG